MCPARWLYSLEASSESHIALPREWLARVVVIYPRSKNWLVVLTAQKKSGRHVDGRWFPMISWDSAIARRPISPTPRTGDDQGGGVVFTCQVYQKYGDVLGVALTHEKYMLINWTHRTWRGSVFTYSIASRHSRRGMTATTLTMMMMMMMMIALSTCCVPAHRA